MSDHNDDTRDEAQRAANQAAADREEQERRAAQEREDLAEQERLRLEDEAERAQGLADASTERASKALDDADDLVEVDMHSSAGIRIAGGGVRHYGPGKGIKVPRALADYLASAPTHATSGNALADRAVRTTLERDHGVTEQTTQEESTGRTVSGAEGRDGDEGETRRTRGKSSEKRGPSASELEALGAEEVERKYNQAVKAGKVKPIPDGKGSGANGNVITADRIDALVRAG